MDRAISVNTWIAGLSWEVTLELTISWFRDPGIKG